VRRTRWIALAVAAAVAAVLVAPGAGAQDGLEATENGVTEDTITVTVVAAIEVPGFPGLFQGNHDGVDAWADYVNNSCKPKNTCLAGRKVEVKHFDSKLSGDEARAAFRQACEDSLALIGTGVLLLQNFDDITQCADKAGNVTGLPDYGVTTTEPNEQCAPTNFAVNPASLQCDTYGQHPQDYIVNMGPTRYYVKKFGKQKGAFIYPSDSASAKNAQVPIFHAQGENGIDIVYEQDVSALAPQSEYTSVAGALRDNGATYAKSGLAFDSTVKMRKEAATQGVDMEVWDCSLQCYDPKFLAPENVDAVEGQYVYMPFLPFIGKTSEAKTNKMLRNFVKYTNKDDRVQDGFAIQGFAAGLFVQQSIEDAIGGDNNALTRQALLDASAAIHDFDADGMISPTDVGGKKPNSCFVLTQVRNGQFVRVHPKKKGTFDCNKKNRTSITEDIIQ
jgi:hypothetical protein